MAEENDNLTWGLVFGAIAGLLLIVAGIKVHLIGLFVVGSVVAFICLINLVVEWLSNLL